MKPASLLTLAASVAALGGLPALDPLPSPQRSPWRHGKRCADPEKKAARKRAKDARRRNRR